MVDRTSIRVALRTLGHHRGFTVVAVLSLAVAIALNTTMYSVLDAIFAPHVSARLPENLYTLRYFGDYQNHLAPGSIERALSVSVHGFEGVTGYWQYGFLASPIAENGSAFRHVKPALVRTNFFDLLGTPALQGRTFIPQDEVEASGVVISDWLADQLFPDESPIGRSIIVAGQAYNIIGVVERSQRFGPLSFDVWGLRQPAQSEVPITLIRYRDKVDIRVAFEELRAIAAQLALAAGEAPGDTRFHLVHFEVKQFQLARFHWALIGAVVAVLLVACANLANLQLARGLARSRELALRSAVGASRRQLIGHLVLESGIIAVAGLTLGVVLTIWSMHIAKSSIPPVMVEYIIQPKMNWRVLIFAVSAAVVCLFLVGLLPAIHVSRVDPDSLLKSGSGTGANREHRRRYGVMVIAQIGFALPVLIGAIILLKSAWIVTSQGGRLRGWLSFDPMPVVSVRVPVVATKDSSLGFADVAAQLEASAKSIRGVLDAASYKFDEPFHRIVAVDQADGSIIDAPANSWNYTIVSPSYFRTLSRQIIQGRDFLDGELDGKSVIIDQSTSLFLFQGGNPLGRAIKFGDSHSDKPWLTIVGVVGDLRDSATLAKNYMYGRAMSEVYRVASTTDRMDLRTQRGRLLFRMYVRASGNVDLAAQRVARAVRSVHGAEQAMSVPLADEYYITQTRTRSRFAASLFTTFALLGIALVAIGVYGIVSHSVAERRRELAVRISLGATARNILHSVLREGNALILSGVAIGLLFTKYTIFWLGNFMMSENDPFNSPLFALIAAFLFGIAAFSAFIPAWRATRIDPVEALRHE